MAGLEMQTLGMIIANPLVCYPIAVDLGITGNDFYGGRAKQIWEAIEVLNADGSQLVANIETVADYVMKDLAEDNPTDRSGVVGYLLEAARSFPDQDFVRLADALRNVTRSRTALQFMSESAETLSVATADETPEAIEQAISGLGMILDPSTGTSDTATSFESIATADEGDSLIEVIPESLYARDRVVLIGGAGVGKGTLMMQIGAAVATGWHPFWPRLETDCPKRVLWVDVENEPSNLAPMARRITKLCGTPSDDMFFRYGQIAGLDLRKTADELKVVQHLERMQPDLLLIGPVYKLWSNSGDDSWEQATKELVAVIDRWRATYGCATILEHHMGHDASRPYGSSVWKWWPDMGVLLSQHETDDDLVNVDKRAFRGERGTARAWPEVIERDPTEGRWPFTARMPHDVHPPLRDLVEF